MGNVRYTKNIKPTLLVINYNMRLIVITRYNRLMHAGVTIKVILYVAVTQWFYVLSHSYMYCTGSNSYSCFSVILICTFSSGLL